MQTIKTAAVVVLLLTVMYGGYTSLTTQPEPVPPEFAGLLEIEDSLGIENGISETLAGVQSAAGDFQNSTVGALQDAASSLSLNSQSTPGPGFGNAFQNTGSVQLQNPSLNSAGLPQNPSISGPSNSGPSNLLSRTDAAIQNVSVDLGKNYPTTPGTFQMPQTGSNSGFDPNAGTAFVDNAVQAAKDIALPAMDSLPSMDSLDSAMTNLAPAGLNVNSLNDAANAIKAKVPNALESLSSGVNAAVNIGAANLGTANLGSGELGTTNLGLENAFKTADRQYANDQLSEALGTLSVFYSVPNITNQQRQKLLSRLDPLAKTVIYSQRHLIQQPHRVGTNETLMEVAAKYKVPWQLLANINGIKDPLVVMPGTELKVIQGPFSAQVDLSARELTIFAGDLYAGRFPVEIGSSPAPAAGTFTVLDKQSKRTYFDASGVPFPPESPQNPYGAAWIDLGNQICIHGSPLPQQATSNGCISLAGAHAKDLFGILSLGSSVTIRR